MAVAFQKAERKQSKLRLAISGPTGSGKTKAALRIATGIGGRIAVLDTENGSASLYADEFDFDVINLRAPYAPERFTDVIKAAEANGFTTLIIDSATHEWSGVGGCLELVDKLAATTHKGNAWSAWNEVTPRHRNFIDSMLQSNIHIIVTLRSKMDTAQEVDSKGKKRVVTLGLKAEQRDGIEYEFTVVLDLLHDCHYALAKKDRTELFAGKDPDVITPETGKMLLNWLNSGKADATLTKQQAAELDALLTQAGIDAAKYCQKRGISGLQDIKQSVFSETVAQLRQKIGAKQQQVAQQTSQPVQQAEQPRQAAMSAFVLDLIRRAGSAKTVKEANALFQYNNVQNLPEDELAALRSAINHRLVQLDQEAKQPSNKSPPLAERIRQAKDIDSLSYLYDEIQFQATETHHQLYSLFAGREDQLLGK